MEFNNIWKTGDVGAVSKIFKEDYKDWNLLFGGVRQGRQPFSEMIKMVFKVAPGSQIPSCLPALCICPA